MQRVKSFISLHFNGFLAAFTVAGIAIACGIPIGGGVPNDSKPAGSIVSSANINGQSGQTASGTATIYVNGASFTLRLEGLSVPVENGLQVIVNMQGGATSLHTTLRASTGNQNYSIGSTTGVFASVDIFSTSARTNYAKAIFPPSGS
jgi:hypothetical protein